MTHSPTWVIRWFAAIAVAGALLACGDDSRSDADPSPGGGGSGGNGGRGGAGGDDDPGAGGTGGDGGHGGGHDAGPGSDPDAAAGGGGDARLPTITITAPAAGAVALGDDADLSVAVDYDVDNFALMAPGSCAGAENCGHVHVLIDQQACNAPGAPYNNAGAAGPTDARFAACATPTGWHTITVELHNDDHSAVEDPQGRVIHAHRKVFACASGSPCIALTEPLTGSVVELGGDADDTVPISYTVAGFTLMAPGTCGGTDACGHVHLLVDGSACNDTGAPYNNAGAASPTDAKLALCEQSTGPHAVAVELHNDDHSPVQDADGNVVASHGWFTTVAAGSPTVSLSSHWGQTVLLGADEDLSAAFDFEVGNFRLEAPGECAGAADCGHVHLLIDGQACNDTGAPYNNAGAASPISAKFERCATATGPHVVSLELHNDDHSPVLDAADRVVRTQTAVNMLARDTQPAVAIDWPLQGAAVTLGGDADKSVPMYYSVQNFTLKAPGTCGTETACGHVHVLVDGSACNDTGAPYNNAGATGPTAAKLGLCADAAGAHEITVELHNDDHSAVMSDGSSVKADVRVTACEPGEPCIAIVSPTFGSTVALDGDADESVSFDYVVTNFGVKAPGSCSGDADCGHVHLLIDDAACNDTGAPYNNAGAASPTAAKFAKCATATGDHEVSVELHNDDHSPVDNTAGNVISASVVVTTN